VLVDINLLPQKEKKRSWGLLGFIIGAALLISVTIAAWFYFQSQVDKLDQLKAELSTNQQLRQVYENQQNQARNVTPATELQQAVTWAESNQKETYLLLDEVTALLPERGFIQSFSFQSTGAVKLAVQFDTTRQAADFLNHLRASRFIKGSDLLSVSTSELEAEDELVSDEDNELPRYIANYTLELDLNTLLSSNQDEEGTP